MLYYIIVNGQQTGPVEIHQLPGLGLTVDSQVWKEGLPQWVKACELPELASYLPQLPPAPPTPPTPPQPPVNPGNCNHTEDTGEKASMFDNNLSATKKPFNWLPFAIIGGIIGWMPPFIGALAGIGGVVLSCIVKGKYSDGDYAAASKLNKIAMILTLVSLGIIAIMIPVVIIASIVS